LETLQLLRKWSGAHTVAYILTPLILGWFFALLRETGGHLLRLFLLLKLFIDRLTLSKKNESYL
jgi:hypothetical protein